MFTQGKNNGTTWDETQSIYPTIPQYIDIGTSNLLKVGMKIVDIPIGLINSLSDMPIRIPEGTY